jgi:nitrogen fixation NifU-like protein
MTDPDDLYGASVLEHGKRPRNTVTPEPCTHSAERSNVLCGDRVRLSLRVAGDRVVELGHDARGCLLCVASASMLTEAVCDRSVAEARSLADRFLRLLAAPGDDATQLTALGPLSAFAPVARDAMRRRCVALPWDALRGALGD